MHIQEIAVFANGIPHSNCFLAIVMTVGARVCFSWLQESKGMGTVKCQWLNICKEDQINVDEIT